MKVIFKKSHLPFLKPTLKNGSGRDYWNLVRTMQDENGLQHQLPAEIMLLEKGAQKNDPWSMCELARIYFNHCGDMFLPMALRNWAKAAKQNDNGAISDLSHYPIIERILSYHSNDGDLYKDKEMKCALLTEVYLHRSWETSWNALDYNTRIFRLNNLITMSCDVLEIPKVELEIVPNMTFNGMIVDGLAHWDYKISLRKEILEDIERTIEVFFHELGHIVTFEIIRGANNRNRLKEVYGLSEDRIATWQKNVMGYEVTTSEEDPDTLSYGVYTLWASFFIDIK